MHYERTEYHHVSSNRKFDPSVMYKQMIILVRSLFSYVRMLPAYALFKASQMNLESREQASFHLESSITSECTDAAVFDSPPANFCFTSISTDRGKLHVSVFYRKECSFDFAETKKQAAINQHIITDYIGGSSTDTSKSSSSSAKPLPISHSPGPQTSRADSKSNGHSLERYRLGSINSLNSRRMSEDEDPEDAVQPKFSLKDLEDEAVVVHNHSSSTTHRRYTIANSATPLSHGRSLSSYHVEESHFTHPSSLPQDFKMNQQNHHSQQQQYQQQQQQPFSHTSQTLPRAQIGSYPSQSFGSPQCTGSSPSLSNSSRGQRHSLPPNLPSGGGMMSSAQPMLKERRGSEQFSDGRQDHGSRPIAIPASSPHHSTVVYSPSNPQLYNRQSYSPSSYPSVGTPDTRTPAAHPGVGGSSSSGQTPGLPNDVLTCTSPTVVTSPSPSIAHATFSRPRTCTSSSASPSLSAAPSPTLVAFQQTLGDQLGDRTVPIAIPSKQLARRASRGSIATNTSVGVSPPFAHSCGSQFSLGSALMSYGKKAGSSFTPPPQVDLTRDIMQSPVVTAINPAQQSPLITGWRVLTPSTTGTIVTDGNRRRRCSSGEEMQYYYSSSLPNTSNPDTPSFMPQGGPFALTNFSPFQRSMQPGYKSEHQRLGELSGFALDSNPTIAQQTPFSYTNNTTTSSISTATSTSNGATGGTLIAHIHPTTTTESGAEVHDSSLQKTPSQQNIHQCFVDAEEDLGFAVTGIEEDDLLKGTQNDPEALLGNFIKRFSNAPPLNLFTNAPRGVSSGLTVAELCDEVDRLGSLPWMLSSNSSGESRTSSMSPEPQSNRMSLNEMVVS